MASSDSDPAPLPLRAHLFGQFSLSIGERVVSDETWPRRGARPLFLLLLITPGYALPRERALDLLWPELAPSAAHNAFYKALHALRRVLEPDLATGRGSAYIASDGEMVRLLVPPGSWLDFSAFIHEIERAQSLPPGERRASLRQALALYTGDLLADDRDRYADWPVARRDSLRQAREHAALELGRLDLAADEPLASLPALEALVLADPILEEAHRALMRAYAAAGQTDRALRQYSRCRRALADEIGAEPDSATEALRQAIAAAAPPTAPAITIVVPDPTRLDNLPTPPTPLVGRRRDVETVQDLLWRDDARLVTLTGPGGIGKTRLAIEAAAGMADEIAGGVGFVNLAPLRDPALVLPTIAAVAGVREAADRPIGELLAAALRQREALLVLDNFEQVLEAGPAIAELLAACPKLKILVTSRERLFLRGEHEVDVPPLDLPGGARLPPPSALARFEAVALFLQTVRASLAWFSIDDENAAIVAAICARLDGLPLAIELAAARVRSTPLADLLAQLDDRLTALSDGPRDLPARQRALRDTVAWSYDLLTAAEQTLFRRLSVYAGGCPLAAINSQDDALVTSLRDKHLIVWTTQLGETRIEMLETIRAYGLDRLRDAGEESAVLRAHAHWVLALRERANALTDGPDEADGLARLEIELDNLRAALAWSLASRYPELGLRLIGAMPSFWDVRGHWREGLDWIERLLALGSETSGPLQATAAGVAGGLAENLGDYDRSRTLHLTARDAWVAAGDRQGIARSLNNLANLATNQGDYEQARALHTESLTLSRALDDSLGIGRSLLNLANIALFQARYDEAEPLFEQCLALFQEIDHRIGRSITLHNLGTLLARRGDLDGARARNEEALHIERELGDRQGIALAQLNLAVSLLYGGDLDAAEPHFRAAHRALEDLGDRRHVAMALHNLAVIAHGRGDRAESAAYFAECLRIVVALNDRLAIVDNMERFAELVAATGAGAFAVRLLGSAEAAREQVAASRQPPIQRVYDDLVVTLAAGLRQPPFTTIWAAGRATPLTDIAAEAIAWADECASTTLKLS